MSLSDALISAADVNGSGEINLADLAHLKQYIMKDKVVLGPQPK